ncbi:MAG: DUF4363 family protein [Clostridia bacterium]|nr:DUF4363 family protein [Clostridia bacterium]
MKKEAIICLVTIILIFAGHYLLQNYSKYAIGETTTELGELNEIMSQENIDSEDVKKKINEIHEKWDKKYNTMAFYIEHNELEKVETELTGLRSSIENEEYSDAQNELARAQYLLKHIEEKNKLSWKNIF